VIAEPELIVMDEPTTGLDPLAIKDIRDFIVKLNKEGKTFLISSHSISDIEKIADRVIILKEGRIVSILDKTNWSNGSSLEEIFIKAVL
jgi:ABC-type multidrug transport system ATPase subunit